MDGGAELMMEEKPKINERENKNRRSRFVGQFFYRLLCYV